MAVKKALQISGLFLMAVATPAFARLDPSLKVLKITNLEFAGQDLLVRYELPCGAKKVGLLADPQPGKRLRLAIVAEQQSTLCTAMPNQVSEKINFIAYSGFRELIKMAPETIDSKLNLASAKELRVFRHRGRLTTQAVFQSECSEFAGIVLQKNGSNQVQLSFLESQPKAVRTSGQCNFDQKVKSINFLRINRKSDLVAAVIHRANPMRAFQLRLAEVDARKSSTQANEEIVEVSYLRKCNEAPVGIVVGTSDSSELKLGMLVAQYFNIQCNKTEPASSWTAYRMKGLPVPSTSAIGWLDESRGFGKFKVVPPSQYAIAKENQSQKLVLDFWTTCAEDIGAVYTRDASQRLVVGILQNPSNSPCKNRYKEVSLIQPLISSKTKAERIFPMKLVEGTIVY